MSYKEIDINRGSGKYQPQTTFSQVALPLIQAAVAVALAALCMFDALLFIWIVGEIIALLVFWPCALWFSWQRNARGLALFVGLALLAFLAVFAAPPWPVYENEATWWFVLRAVLIPTTWVFPVVAYRVFRRMVTDAQYENLTSSVTVTRGTLNTSDPVGDTVDYAPPAENEEAFEWDNT
jgi:hypothetical protein